jgi:hypothetical protein
MAGQPSAFLAAFPLFKRLSAMPISARWVTARSPAGGWRGAPNGGTDRRARSARPRDADPRARATALRGGSQVRRPIEQLPAAIYVDSPDPDGPTYYVSPQIRNLLGVTPADYIQKASTWESLIHLEDRDQLIVEYLQ